MRSILLFVVALRALTRRQRDLGGGLPFRLLLFEAAPPIKLRLAAFV